jgi:AmpD protein
MTTKVRMMVDRDKGLLKQALYLPSPHCDARPDGMPIDLVVIHGISLPPGEFGGDVVERFFTGTLDMTSHPAFAEIAHLRVSAHLFIKRNGDIIQFVPFLARAWHAGQSSFDGRTQCNDFSIGIELEGTDTTPYEPIQYDQLASVLDALQEAYPAILPDRIVGHSDIAPQRKTDPGPSFDWAYLKGKLI